MSTRTILELQTERLRLLALSARQMDLYLRNPVELEGELEIPLSRAVLSPTVERAIAIKIMKMARAPMAEHPWYTYWLLIVNAHQSFGAGLAGFKGAPDETKSAELGYGIDPIYRNKGYMTEAVRALIGWAFQSSNCQTIIAHTIKDNTPSNRVLEKVGLRVTSFILGELVWSLQRDDWFKSAGQE